MKYSILYFALALICNACQEEIFVDDVLSNFKINQKEVFADGQTTISLSVVIKDKSSENRRNVIFTTSSGTFISSGSNRYTSKSEFENSILTCKAVLRVSTQPGTITLSVTPEFDSPLKEFVLTDSIIAKHSIPLTIKLEPSSYGIAANYINEIFLTAKLKSSFNSFVSKGYKVILEDFLPKDVKANGRFRELSNATSDSSKVTGYYSAFNHPIGTQLKIQSTLLDDKGLRTAISDSIFIHINQ